jgi:alkylation response protein AidB-like acyl-CoA dehydrogenase
MFVSDAATADIILVFATVNGVDGPDPTAVFVVDRNTDGIHIGQRFNSMAGDAMYEVVLNDVQLTADSVLGGEDSIGSAMVSGFDNLSKGRLVVAAQANAAAEYALRLGVAQARTRRAFGKRIGSFQHVQELLVQSWAELESSKLLTTASAAQVDDGRDMLANAAMAKLVATEAACRITDRMLQVHGAAGCIADSDVEHLYRAARIGRIIEGTSEIQKVILAHELGLGSAEAGDVVPRRKS